jgi:hypothetical protein
MTFLIVLFTRYRRVETLTRRLTVPAEMDSIPYILNEAAGALAQRVILTYYNGD